MSNSVIEAAERYLSRQPHCESDEDGNPLYTRNQMLRAFCAGEIAIIDKPWPGTRTITGETARGEARDLSPPISRALLGKIVDEVFDGAIEDASVIEEIYAAIKRHEAASPLADVLSVIDAGNSITVHFCEIKSAKAFRDALPVAATPAPSSQVIGGDLAQAGRDIRILLTQVDWLEELTGEKLGDEDAALVAQIRQSWAAATDAPQLQHVLSITQHPNVEGPNREQSGIEADIQQLGMPSSSKGPSRGGDEPLDPNRNNGSALQQVDAGNVPPDEQRAGDAKSFEAQVFEILTHGYPAPFARVDQLAKRIAAIATATEGSTDG